MNDNAKREILTRATAAHARALGELDAEPGAVGRPKIRRMADRIEHTLLGSGAAAADLERLLDEALEHRFRAVCVLPRDVERAAARLEGSGVIPVTVVDFPLAGGTRAAVAAETGAVVGAGAAEVDMVVDVRALRAGELERVRDGVRGVVDAARGAPVKVILETGLLDAEQIAAGCAAAEAGGARYVKTSTGFGPRGASVEDVAVMRACVAERLGVKASGGIRTAAAARELAAAGADLIGTSAGPVCVG